MKLTATLLTEIIEASALSLTCLLGNLNYYTLNIKQTNKQTNKMAKIRTSVLVIGSEALEIS